jgi:hypothetical protein
VGAVLAVAVFVVVVLVVTAPLRRGVADREQRRDAGRRADLEARRDAKYREIREAELDFRTGKLAEDDFRSLDRELRAEAIGILRELDRYAEGP